MAMAFISHSSRQDEFAAKVRERVQTRLKGLGWDVRADMDALKGGEEWRSVLYHWLADCDAVVVLLGGRALESPWVRREVNILLWRRALGSPLTIVPALLGDIRSAEVRKAGFSELEPLQFIRVTPSGDKDADAEGLASQIAGRLPSLAGAWQDDSPMPKWIRKVTWCLQDVQDEQALAAAARQLLVDDEWWRPPSILEGHRFLAHQLLGGALDGRSERALSELAYFMESERLARIIPLVAPTWVDGESARQLLGMPNAQRPIVAVLNARLPQTAEHYVKRAGCCALNFRIATASAFTGENVQDEFLRKECEPAVRDLLGIPLPFPIEDEKPETGDVPFLIVDSAGVPIERVAAAVHSLQARFPWLNIVILTGQMLPNKSDLASWELGSTLILDPPLGERDELTASRVVQRLMDIVNQVNSQMAGAA
jgi:hypothetical protein